MINGIRVQGWRLPPNDIVMHHPDNCIRDHIDRNGGNALEPKAIAAILGISTRQVRRIAEAGRDELAGSVAAADVLEEMVER